MESGQRKKVPSASEKDVILRAWKISDDVAVIKDVATKGSYIDLCVEYLAGKRRISLEESRKYFDHHVDIYVTRLLKERLICKAQDVLLNIGRNVEHVYFQLAHSTGDLSLKIDLLEHLRKRDPKDFERRSKEYEVQCRMLLEIAKNESLMRRITQSIGDLKLENLYSQGEDFRKRLVASVYYELRLDWLIPLLDRIQAWRYLVSKEFCNELLIWTTIYYSKKHSLEIEISTQLRPTYNDWEVDDEMFREALQIVKPPEVLRNMFAANGYIFPDEKENVQKILLRLFTTESFLENRNLIKELPLIQYIIKNDDFNILLEEPILNADLEDVKPQFPNREDDIAFLISLKSYDIKDPHQLGKVSRSIGSYLQKFRPNLYADNPVIRLFELLADNVTIEDMKKPENMELLEKLPYLEETIKRAQCSQPECTVTMEDFLQKFNKVNLRRIAEDLGDEPVSFSNETLSKKYASKIQRNYCDFIRQNRSTYAVYCHLLDQFGNYSKISKAQLCISAEHVTEMALRANNDPDFVLSCIAFVEMLGFDTKAIRAYLKLKQLSCDTIDDKITLPDQLIKISESKVIKDYHKSSGEFPVRTYNAIVTIAKSLQTNIWPDIHISDIASADNWLHFVLFAQYFDIPLPHLAKFAKMFKSPAIGEHLIRAFCQDNVVEKPKRHQSFSRQEFKRRSKNLGDEKNMQATSMDTFTSSSSGDTTHLQKSRNQLKLLQQFEEKDIFAVILLSAGESSEEDIGSYQKFIQIINDRQSYSMSLNLIRNAITYNFPILAILAADTNDRNLNWCWATWLLTSVNFGKKTQRCNDELEFCLSLIEYSVKTQHVRTLYQSFQIFFKDSEFNYLTKFLLDTSEHIFEDETVTCLRFYFQAVSNESITLPLTDTFQYSLNDFSIKLIFLHLKYNFSSSHYRHMFLDTVCKANLSRPRHDFELLKRVTEIIMFTKAEIDYERLITEPGYSIRSECRKICSFLENVREFEKAIQLATILNMTISNIVYAKWVNSVEEGPGELDLSQYEKETETYILPPEILINFYLYVSTRDFISDSQRYHILKKSLDVIKSNLHLPNEFFDRDNVEFEMILTYLESDLTIDDIEVYHSNYYEKVLVQERCVLYKSFPELKELSGVDNLKAKKVDLTETTRLKLEVLIYRLLDDGDIVQALRQQAMFDYRPIDLHFIVFCMAMAEGITHIYNLPNNLRQLLIDVENNALHFNKRILGRNKSQHGMVPPAKPPVVDSVTNLEFEEIPSREKQEVLKALQGIVFRLKHGVDIGKRILMVYRAAMHLDKEYLDVLKTKDALFLLKNAIEEDCLEKLVVISDILMSSQMSEQEVADFLSAEIATAVIRPRFYILNPTLPTIQTNLWGFDLEKDFHLILELGTNSILLGNCLLDYCDVLKIYRKYQDNKDYERDLEENQQVVNAFDSLRDIIRRYGLPTNHSGTSQVLSHKKQNTIYVELLIKAHECFVHELCMEGIANVLNRAKTLNSILSAAKSWNLIVRLLTGIGRYREMYYCIDTLISNDQFESLLGQFDEDKAKGLRQAIIQYIHEICPQNREYYRLTALHFSMFKELAEMWETEGNSTFAKIISNYQVAEDPPPAKNQEDGKMSKKSRLRCSNELLIDLNHAMENFTHATENFLMDNKLKLAQKTVAQAELAAMQNHLASAALAANEETCICVLNIQKYAVFRELVNNYLSIPQALILQRAYSYEIVWSEAILNQYILLDRRDYIDDYCNYFDLKDNTIENIVKSFQVLTNVTPAMEENMSHVVELVQSISLRYKLASLLGFRKIITALINDQSLYYLKDTNYGRNEIDFS